MGKPWSEARHLKIAEKRMQDVKSGKAKTMFFAGQVAEFKKGRMLYQFGVFHDGVEFHFSKDSKGKGKFNDYNTVLRKQLKGKHFNTFVQRMVEWLRFPMGHVVYKKREKK